MAWVTLHIILPREGVVALPSAAVHFLVFIHEVGSKGRACPEHEHRLVDIDSGRIFLKKRMTNALFVTCVAVELSKRALECWVFDYTGVGKGGKRWTEFFACFRINHTSHRFNGMNAVRDRLRKTLFVPLVDFFRSITEMCCRACHATILDGLNRLLRCLSLFLAAPGKELNYIRLRIEPIRRMAFKYIPDISCKDSTLSDYLCLDAFVYYRFDEIKHYIKIIGEGESS